MARGAAVSERATVKTYLSEQRVIKVVPWPGIEKDVGILVLNCDDIQSAVFEARSHFDRQRQPVDALAEQWFLHEIEYQLVRRILIDPDSKNPSDRIFLSAAQFRKAMSPDLVQWFLDRHAEAKDEHAKELGLIERPDHAD